MKKQILSLSNDQPSIAKKEPKKTILVVEDDRTHRTFVEKILIDLDFDVVAAENGYIALSHLEGRSKYDLILMDWDMPELNGIETVKEIRKKEKESGLKRIPVMAFTVSRDPETRESCIAAGMDAYLPKDVWLPRWQSTLLNSIQNLLDEEFDLGNIEEDTPSKKPIYYDIEAFDEVIYERAATLLKDELDIAISEFLEDAAAYIQDIENGLQIRKADKVQRASHPLKSNSKSFGLIAVSNLAKSINDYALQGDLGAAAPLLTQLRTAFHHAEKRLRSYQKNI